MVAVHAGFVYKKALVLPKFWVFVQRASATVSLVWTWIFMMPRIDCDIEIT